MYCLDLEFGGFNLLLLRYNILRFTLVTLFFTIIHLNFEQKTSGKGEGKQIIPYQSPKLK